MLQDIWQFLENFLPPRDVIDNVAEGRKIRAKRLRELLRSCPICQSGFGNHQYSQFAMTINAEENAERYYVFLKAADNHLWRELCSFQEFQGDRDTIIATALRCPGKGLAFILEDDPWALEYDSQIISCEPLEAEMGQQLDRVINEDRWYSL